MIPVFFIVTILLVLWIQYQKSRTDRSAEEIREAFWAKEHEANTTRKKDISNLDYITVPIDSLPFPETEREDITEIQQLIKRLAVSKIVNFTGISNTDLKLQYGAPNINFLMEYDKNYLDLVRSLYKYGKYLYEENLKTDAAAILEYAMSIKTDVSANYTLLATIYKEKNEIERINFIISCAEELQSMTKQALLSNLVAIRDSAVSE